jgi:DedD protein
MDSAMRDLDQLRERGEQTTGRKVGLFVLASVLSLSSLLAMGLMVDTSDAQNSPHAADALAQLALSGQAASAPLPSAAPEIKPESLSFPTTLLDREEAVLEATVRAAEAEHRRLSGESAMVDLPTPSLAEVPAANLAVSDNARLSRVAKRDRLVAETVPTRTSETAPTGREGAYTLQVVSYEDRAEAETFASALRSRGHKAFVTQADVPDRGRFFRVRVGPFETRKEARSYQDSFEQAEEMRTILVSNKPK